MRIRMENVIAGLAMLAGFALSQGQTLAQVQKFEVTSLFNNRIDVEPPVFEEVGPLARLTVHVSYTTHSSDPRLEGTADIIGVWMIDMRKTPWSYVGHGKWTAALAEGGEVEGTWCSDASGTMRGTASVTGGELDGAILSSVSVAGSPFLGWIEYEVRILLPASK